MKKVISVFLFLMIPFYMLNAESSFVNSANRNTALRCLKLAESCLVGNDYENALKQAELGLSYDENISDLIYLKAAAEISMGRTKSEVIQVISEAFEKNDWVGYSKNGARILYADLLSDTGRFNESMDVLDEGQMIFSADAEFIRIKNLYRMGTEASVNSARLKLNSARRIYPSDLRFPNIFFMFEFVYLMENNKINNGYEIPDVVRSISSFYIKKLPDYTGEHLELELLASFFAEKDEKNRLVNAIYSKNQTENPVLAIAGLDVGLFDDQQAFDMFFEMSGESVSLELLQILLDKIQNVEVQNQLMEKMLNFSGILEIDENYDLQNELIVEYELGRPKSIKYDKNNDGVIDLFSTCDFGAPAFVYFAQENAELFYDSYPSVSKISFKDRDFTLNFLHDDYYFSPYSLIPDSYIQKLGLDFYVPYLNQQIAYPSSDDLFAKASSVTIPVKERDDAYVVYTLADGKFVNADFFEKDLRYAYCDFGTNLPVSRFADYDADGYFEIVEIYDEVEKSSSLYDSTLIENNFSILLKDYPLYLKKILIDRNGNTFYEFTEQYLENNGKICCWDNDDDGVVDCQYIRYPAEIDESLVEETIYFEKNGSPDLILSTLDGVPVKMILKNSEVMVYAGEKNGLYWIEDEGTPEMENLILQQISSDIAQGTIELLKIEDKRISVILVGKNLYCKVLPDSNIADEELEELKGNE